MPFNTRKEPYVKPTRPNVSSIIRIDSVDPLMEGVPLHEAVEGMTTDLL